MRPPRPERARQEGQRQAGEQEEARPGRVERQVAQGEAADGEPGQGQERQAAVVDEQAGEPAQRERDPAHRRHPAPIRPRPGAATAPRCKATVARAVSRKPAVSASADQSAPGQATPSPSPAQKVPKPHKSTPTASLSAFSGTRASGRCSASPSSRTSRSAARAPRLAGNSRPRPAAPIATTMNTTSMPSSVTILNAVAIPTPSQARIAAPRRRSAAVSSAKPAASSRRGMTPAARRIAFLSQRRPKRRTSVPTASCTAPSGMRVSAGPRPSTSSASTARPSPVPVSAGRQPRTVPTASTTVSASTNSTSEARKAARTVGAAWTQTALVNIGVIRPVPSSRRPPGAGQDAERQPGECSRREPVAQEGGKASANPSPARRLEPSRERTLRRVRQPRLVTFQEHPRGDRRGHAGHADAEDTGEPVQRLADEEAPEPVERRPEHAAGHV